MVFELDDAFPLISDGGTEGPRTFADVNPGGSNLRDEPAYPALNRDDRNNFDYDPDDVVGTVHIGQTKALNPSDPNIVRVVFQFGRDSLTASGVLPSPVPPGEEARLAIVGATGALKKLTGRDIAVRERNPKRWDVV
jgi:hypothetical protein